MRPAAFCRTCSGSKGSISPCCCAMRRIQLSDLMLIDSRPLQWSSAVFDHDLWEQCTAITGAARQHRSGPPGGVDIGLRSRAIRLGDDRGSPSIRLLANARIERQLSEQRDAVLGGQTRPAAGAEDVIDVTTLSEAARSLGASWFTVIVRVIAPNMREAILNALLLTWALVLGEFTIAYLLLYNNLQEELYSISRNTPNAGVIFSTSFAALMFAFVLLLILSYAGRRRRGRG